MHRMARCSSHSHTAAGRTASGVSAFGFHLNAFAFYLHAFGFHLDAFGFHLDAFSFHLDAFSFHLDAFSSDIAVCFTSSDFHKSCPGFVTFSPCVAVERRELEPGHSPVRLTCSL